MSKIQNIFIDQGATFSHNFAITTANNEAYITTGSVVTGSMKKNYTAANSASFTVAASNGSVTFSLDANTTASLVAGRYVYNIIMTGNTVIRLLEGIATVTPGV